MQHVLITGTDGFLGTRLASFYKRENHVTACTHTLLDITNKGDVCSYISMLHPQLVLHCAAISDTGRAEAEPRLSHAVNVQGAENMAFACNEIGAKLVYMSSDQVYNGCARQGPLPENTPLAPQTAYARQKLEAEQRVQAVCQQAVGLRLTWLYSVPQEGALGRGMLCQLEQAYKERLALRYAVHEVRGITWVQTLVEAMPALARLPGGVYNAGCSSCGDSTDALARFAAHAMGLPDEVLIQSDEERFATHPRNLAMDMGNLHAQGIRFCDSRAGLADALQNTRYVAPALP